MKGLPPLRLVVIDCLQLLSPDERRLNREREVAEISASLKSLAREMDIAVLCSSRLKRPDTGKPGLTDLRVSGAVERDADIVAFILRRETLRPDGTVFGNSGELQVKKHRDGPTGTVRLEFVKRCASFLPCASRFPGVVLTGEDPRPAS
jgi:replicative DNA helicase